MSDVAAKYAYKASKRRQEVQTRNTLIVAGVGLLGFVMWSKYRAISNLVFSPGSITGMDLIGGVPFIYFTVFVQNTASTGVQVDSFAGNIWANGQLIGNVSNFQPIYIPPNSQTIVPVTAQLGLFGIVNTIVDAFQNGNIKQSINVTGYANGVNIQVPINIKMIVGQ